MERVPLAAPCGLKGAIDVVENGKNAPHQRFLRELGKRLHVLLPPAVHVRQLGNGPEELVLARAGALEIGRELGGIFRFRLQGLFRTGRLGALRFVLVIFLSHHGSSASLSPM